MWIGSKSKYAHEKISEIDGLSVEKKDVWFNARPSNTEPLIRFVVEGFSKNAVEKQKKELINIINTNRS